MRSPDPACTPMPHSTAATFFPDFFRESPSSPPFRSGPTIADADYAWIRRYQRAHVSERGEPQDGRDDERARQQAGPVWARWAASHFRSSKGAISSLVFSVQAVSGHYKNGNRRLWHIETGIRRWRRFPGPLKKHSVARRAKRHSFRPETTALRRR